MFDYQPPSGEIPFVHVLGTNYIPTDGEARQIKDLLSQPLRDRAYLDGKIARLQASIDHLQRERKKIQDHIDRYEALISPARRLPAEIVAHIFLQCLPRARNPVRSITEAPLLLGRISRHWRSITLTTPQLWAAIHVVIPQHYDRERNRALADLRCESMRVWLGRSGVLPLSISMVNPAYGYLPDGSVSLALVHTMIQFSRRWKNIELRVPTSAMRLFDNLTMDDVPLLESIQLNDTRNWEESIWGHLPFLEGAPRLRRVSVIHLQANPLHRIHGLPLSQLTELSLQADVSSSCVDPNTALTTLQQCPLLRACTLAIGYPEPGAFLLSPHPPLTLEFLQSLTVHTAQDHMSELEAILEHLTLPRLSTFALVGSLGFDHDLPFVTHVPFMTLLSFPCSLTELRISLIPITESALVECLERVPALKSLNIDDWSSTNLAPAPEGFQPIVRTTVISHLTPVEGIPGAYLCPNLATFRLTGCSVSSDLIASFIEARRSARANAVQLEHVDITFSHMGEDITARLQPHVDEGLRLSLSFPLTNVWPDNPDTPWAGLDNGLIL